MDTLTPANYFEAREDCGMTCPIAAGLTGDGLRHNGGCAITAGTGHAYREAVAVEAERLRLRDEESEPTPRAYALIAGSYADEQVIGVHLTDDPEDAAALALHMSGMRALAAAENRYGVGSISSDLIAVRAEPVALLDSNGAAIERPVRLEIVR